LFLFGGSKIVDGGNRHVVNLQSHRDCRTYPAQFLQHNGSGQIAKPDAAVFRGSDNAGNSQFGHGGQKFSRKIPGLFHGVNLRRNFTFGKFFDRLSKQFFSFRPSKIHNLSILLV
jgi:hypothetical protein